MNNKLTFAIGILIICFGCDIQDRGNLYKTSATIYLINESSSVVKSIDSSLGYEIQPGETVIHKETSEGEESKRPTINSYQPFSTGPYLFFYIDNSKCETGLRHIENYVNRKEISDLTFELTFRFTDLKMNNAESCN